MASSYFEQPQADHQVEMLLDRPLPQNPEAERAVLGSILINKDAFSRVSQIVKPEDFFKNQNRAIFISMHALAADGREIDLLTIKEELFKRAQINSVGGAAYISSLADGIPDVANVERYARIVKEKSALRQLSTLGIDVARAGSEPGGDAAAIVRAAEESLRCISRAVPDSRSLNKRERECSIVRAWEQTEPEPMKYVIEGLVHDQQLAGIFGDGGSGKSLLSIYTGLCVATGSDFFGRVVAQRPVLFLDWELEQSEFLRRAYRIARGMGLGRLPESVNYVELSLPLTDARVFDFCRAAVRDTAAGVVFVDSFAPASCASDQIAPSEIVPFMQQLRSLGTVIALDHVPKTIGAAGPPVRAYGSTYKHNLVRSSMRLERAERGGMRLTQVKNNFGPSAEPITFAMVHTYDTVRFEQIEANDSRLAGLAERAKTTAERILDELAQFGEDGASAGRLSDLIGCTKKTISNSLSSLHTEGRVEHASRSGAWRIASELPDAIGKTSGSRKVG